LVAHPSPDVYGSDLQLIESIAGLRKAGFAVTVCLPAPGPLVERLGDTTVRVRSFPVLRKSLLSPLALARFVLLMPRDLVRLIATVRAVRPDVVYVNTVTIPLWILAARLTRTPVLVHVHEAEEDAPRPVRAALAAPLLLAAEVIANSVASQRVLVDAMPRLAGSILVIHNGIRDNGAAPARRALPGRVALIARLSPRKGIDVALEAVALLRRGGRQVEIDVCGTAYEGYEWFERQIRERSAESDLVGAVHLLGYVNPTDAVLASASVVLVPSRVEPFGNTAVEAQLAGRPVIVSDVQGLAEIVVHGRTGLLVPPGDAPALAFAISRLLDDPEFAHQLADAGLADAHERFSLARYQDQVVACVERTQASLPRRRSRNISVRKSDSE
jgi:glycosyltransferase involved in cell wall biosynthesis